MTQDKICEGCLSYERAGTLITDRVLGMSAEECYGLCQGYSVKDVDCPCQHCLIKAMCNSVCDLLKERQWYKEYWSNRMGNIYI